MTGICLGTGLVLLGGDKLFGHLLSLRIDSSFHRRVVKGCTLGVGTVGVGGIG